MTNSSLAKRGSTRRAADLAEQRKQRRAEAYALQDQIGFILRVANQDATIVFQEILRAEFKGDLVTTTQFAVLVTLWERGDLAHCDLGAATRMDLATLQNVVQRLVRRLLVTVRHDSSDGRRRLVRLTPKGKRLAFRLRAMGTDVSSAILAQLDASERTQLIALLLKMLRRRQWVKEHRLATIKPEHGRAVPRVSGQVTGTKDKVIA